MGKNTHIMWSQHTWNVARGCTKKNSDCANCYMMRDGGWRGYDGTVVKRTKSVFNLPDKLPPGELVFTSSLTDIFHAEIDSFREDAYVVMRRNTDKIYQFLSKRWERAEKCLPSDWGDGWENVWLGFSAGSPHSYNPMMPYLKKIKAKTKWISIEPLTRPLGDMRLMTDFKGVLDWVVVGGESGFGKIPNDPNVKYGYRKCEQEWIADIVRQCHEAGIPVFVKQLGTHLAKTLGLKDKTGTDMSEFPEELRFQDFPKHFKRAEPLEEQTQIDLD